jgi:Asp-tRNA(Asn)/Glu-tRNA(Gln) amidotransferase A subunit family amidase
MGQLSATDVVEGQLRRIEKFNPALNAIAPPLQANLHTVIFNMTGHPVVTMPIGRSPEGLPIGVQVIGSRWQEMALLHAAHQIASVTKGFQRPPVY